MALEIKQVNGLQAALDNQPSTGRLNSAGPIKQVVVQTATDTIDIVGLSLDTDGEYMITASIECGAASIGNYWIYVGDPTLDTTNANYDGQLAQDGSVFTHDEPRFTRLDVGDETYLNMYIAKDPSGKFRAFVQESKDVPGTLRSNNSAIVSVNTYGSITRIQLKSQQANGFGVGTSIRVYRLGGSLPTATSINPLDIKRAADGFDDEFEETALDSSWTAVTGSSGSVVFDGNGAPGGGNGVYDLTSRPGWLLMQGDNGELVELRKDRTLAVGESYILCGSAGGAVIGGVNNEVQFGFAINDADTGYNDGNSIAFYIAEHDGTGSGELELQVGGFGSYAATQTEDTKLQPGGQKIYLRILRTSSNYEFHYSRDGTAWAFVESIAVGNVANNLWIFNHPTAAVSSPNPSIMAVDWIRLGNADLDPWPLADGSTTVPTATGEWRGALLSLSSDYLVGTGPAAIQWDTADEDTDGFYNGANPTRITIPDGVTRVQLSVGVDWSGGSTDIVTEILKNGAAANGIPKVDRTVTAGVDLDNLTSASIPVVAGDYFEVFGQSNTALTARGGIDRTWFSIEVIEPIVALTDEGSVNVTNADSPYTVPNTKRVIYCDTTAGAITLNLPALANNDGQVYEVKILAGSNTVTVDPDSAETIEGSATYAFSGVNEARTFRAKSINGNLGWYLLSSTEVPTIPADSNLSTTTYTCTATEAVGDLVYISAADTVAQADASAIGTARAFGYITEKPTSTSCRVSLAPGPVSATGLTVGAPVYLSDTAGAVSATEGTVIVEVGIADTTTSFVFTGYKIVS